MRDFALFRDAFDSFVNRRESVKGSDICLTPGNKKCLMVWLLELPSGDIAQDLRRLQSQFSRRHVVFVHSKPEFAPMVAAGVVFEALPPLSMMRAHSALVDWGAWATDRLALLKASWAPDRALTYGMAPEAYLAEARAIAASSVSDACGG